MNLSGCASNQEVPPLLHSEREYPKIDQKLVELPKKRPCIDPGAKQYEVAELNKGLRCYRSDRDALHKRLETLIQAEKNREKELVPQ